MIFKQIHKLPIGSNWSIIGFTLAITIGLILLLKYESRPNAAIINTNNIKE